MGTTNILPFNQGLVNAESDGDYLVDTQRTGGAVTDSLLPSLLFNKFAAQASIVAAALCQALANKGYTLDDAAYSAMVAVMQNIRTTADEIPLLQTVSFATTIAFSALAAPGFELTLTGNVTSSTLANQFAGQLLVFVFNQDGVGGRTFVWPTNVYGAGVVGSAANSNSVQLFVTFSDLTVHAVTPMVVNGSVLPFVVPASITSSGAVNSSYAEITEKVDSSGGTVTRTLFTAVGNSGKKVNIKKVDSSGNPVNIAFTGGQTGDGSSSLAITLTNNSLTLQSDGSNWIII